MLRPAYVEYRKTQDQLRDVNQALLLRQKESEELREEIHGLKTNPKAIERVAREKFGWCKPDEKIYDFSQPEHYTQPGPTPLLR